uniref:glucan 1,3-beta-glucosidase n=1 Tax=Blastobotrys adeninivorans TaxID=409370 RepID=A0A060T6J2_BLAAD
MRLRVPIVPNLDIKAFLFPAKGNNFSGWNGHTDWCSIRKTPYCLAQLKIFIGHCRVHFDSDMSQARIRPSPGQTPEISNAIAIPPRHAQHVFNPQERSPGTEFTFLNDSPSPPPNQSGGTSPGGSGPLGTPYESTRSPGISGGSKESVSHGSYGIEGGAGAGEGDGEAKQKSWFARHKRMCIIGAIVLIIVILAAVLIPVGIVVIGHKGNSSSSGSSGSSGTTDGNGDSNSDDSSIPDSAKGTVLDPSTWLDKTDFNTTFTNATVGGLPIMGLNSSWDDSARANSKVVPLSESFEYGKTPIHGVNLGGWLVVEPFITPSFFEKYGSHKDGVVDEWTLVDKLNQTGGEDLVKQTLEKHYSTFVTESTFKEIAEAGLDHVRIPYGYWALDTYPGDHFFPKVCWRYLLRGIEWARKYGLRVNIDFHSLPGGQNGWNHSGRQGFPHWLNGTEGEKYGNDSLDMHRQLAEFFSQDRYKNVVTMYGLVNEPKLETLNKTVVTQWTKDAYKIVRDKGFNGTIVFNDGFLGATAWKGIFPEDEYPNLLLDLHQYTIFDKDLIKFSHNAKVNFACDNWGQVLNSSTSNMTGHGATMVGEWSQADNDCTLYVNNVGVGSRWEGDFNPGFDTEPVLTPSCPEGSNCTCDPSNSSPDSYSDAYKTFLKDFAEAQMQTFVANGAWGYMYWTWDTEGEKSTQWSYKKSRDAGMMPKLAYDHSSFYSCSNTTDYSALGLSESY